MLLNKPKRPELNIQYRITEYTDLFKIPWLKKKKVTRPEAR